MAKNRSDERRDSIERLAGVRPREENTSRTQNTQGTASEHTEHTERARPDYAAFAESELVTFSVRLTPDDKQRLKDYFERRGTPLSQGIRQLLTDFIERNGL